jgi:signal transduction histidine kinase
MSSTMAMLIAMLFAAIFLATLVMLGFMHLATERALLAQEQAVVAELRDDLVGEYLDQGRSGLVAAIGERLQVGGGASPVILLARPGGERIAGNLARWPAGLAAKSRWAERTLARVGGRGPDIVGLSTTRLGDGSRLLVGHVLAGAERRRTADRSGLTLALLVALPLSLAVAFALGRIIAWRVARIAAAAERVAAGELSHRVPADASGDPFDRLGQALNRMLDRIELLVTELRLVTDGLAHDLGMPITRLRTAIERAIGETGSAESLAALEAASAEADKLLAMLATALQISRAEAGIGSERLEPTEVRQMLEDLAEIYGPAAEEQGVALTCSAPAGLIWPLHRELIGQALVNLIENALRHARGGRTIALSAEEVGRDLVLAVADDGVGIAPADYERAQRRFVRFDPARSGTGAGLGLSLVSAAARLHGGRIVLSDNRPGLKVEIVLPVRN